MSENKEKQIEQPKPIAFDPFSTVLREGELDMITELERILIENGLAQEVKEYYNTNAAIQDGVGLCYEGQRHLLNQFWLLQLLNLQNLHGISTMDDRYCLITNGTPEQWINLFKNQILPTAIKYRLPSAT